MKHDDWLDAARFSHLIKKEPTYYFIPSTARYDMKTFTEEFLDKIKESNEKALNYDFCKTIDHRDISSVYPDIMSRFIFGYKKSEETTKMNNEFRIARKVGVSMYTFADDMNADTKVKYFIKKIIFNPPATIIFWSDGTKTVVKAHNEVFDPEKGIAIAFFKRFINVEGKCSHVSVMRKMIDTAEFHEPKKEEPRNEESALEFTSSVFADFIDALKKAIIKSGLATTVVENTTHTPENEEVPEDGK